MSKTIAPALRVGVVIANEEVIKKMTIGKQATDVQTNSLAQAIVNKYILQGMVDPQLKKAIPIYREKRDAMLNALKKYMPKNFKYTNPDGGLFIWGEFTDGTSAQLKFNEAIANKVAYVCGNDFFADGKGDNFVRLNFSNATVEQIETGIKMLGKVFSEQGDKK
jgi:2-aminoadipate transaminase